MNMMRKNAWVELLAVGVLSAGMMAYELTLTRLFALAQFYHFAFMAISLALLGGGAAGTFLAIWPNLGQRRGWWSAGFCVGVLISFAILKWVPFDSYAIAWQPIQFLYLVLTFGGAFVPFFCNGIVVGALLSRDRQKLHRVYAANLSGAALGSLAVLPFLDILGGEGTLFISAAFGLIAAVLFESRKVIEHPRHDLRQSLLIIFCYVIGSALILLIGIVQPSWSRIRLSPYKALSQLQLAPNAEHTVTEWSASVRVDVVESDSIHIMPGLSSNAAFSNPPLQAGLTLDGDNLTPITHLSPSSDLARDLSGHVPLAISSYLMPNAEQFLILNPGAGWDVLMTLAADQDLSLAEGAVTVVERHAPVLSVLRGAYGGFTYQLLDDPRVALVVEHNRTFLQQTGQRYDVINMALSDSYHPVTAGAFTLTEDYRYTVEAVGDALEHLKPDGILIITRWLQTPPTESLRVLATINEALRLEGVAEPGLHIGAFRSMRTITFVVSPSQLSEAQLHEFRVFSDHQGYDLVWLPGLREEELNRYNRLPQPIYYRSFKDLLVDPEFFIASYLYEIRPPTDSRPFFFNYFRWKQTPQILRELGHTWQPFGGSGYLVLVVLLILVTLLAIALIVLPLLAAGKKSSLQSFSRGVRWRSFIYFAMLGLGFLFIEIPLAQQFILYVGHPTTALAIVLFALLLFSGIGSMTAPKWPLRLALSLLIVLSVLMPAILQVVFSLTLGWGLFVRVVISIIVLAPVGLLLGVPFSRGLAILESVAPGITPWAWAVNGSVSVMSAVLAIMIALRWGFPVVLWLGAATYLIAMIAIWKLTGQVSFIRHEHRG